MERCQFAEHFQAVYPRLWLIAAGMVGNRSDADDIVQEAVVIAYEKRASFSEGNFGAWAAQFVRGCASNYIRKKKRRRTGTTDPSTMDRDISDRRSDVALGADQWRTFVDDKLLAALSRLSSEARACLLLRVVDERSYGEISQLLGIPRGTAMSHVHRSRTRLRRDLHREHDTPGSTPPRGSDD